MKAFIVSNSTHWVKVTRYSDKSFVLATGYKGEINAHKKVKMTTWCITTIKEAREYALYLLSVA